MPIFSYLAIPQAGSREQLVTDLTALDYCQVVPAENQDVIVLVTDTPDEACHKHLLKILENLQSLQSLSLTFGYDEKE